MRGFVLTLFVFLSYLADIQASYLLTVPRKLTIGEQSQVCATLTDAGTFQQGDGWKITVTENEQLKKVLINAEQHTPTVGDSNTCHNVTLPKTDNFELQVSVDGTIAGKPFSEGGKVRVSQTRSTMFIKSDKSLYKPGQTVQIRFLTLEGPFLDISRKNYSSIYIQTPDSTRIQQWLNVDNSAGLVHLSFDLHSEAVDGTYTISVEQEGGMKGFDSFNVEDYVLPRYELTITGPEYILGSHENVTLKLCARYTFGQPVKGVANLSVAVGTWTVYANITQQKEIDGCADFTYNAKDLRFDDNNCHIRVSNLRAYGMVKESGTDVDIFGENSILPVHRKGIFFRDISPSSVRKQHLPVVNRIHATTPDRKPAVNEILEVCTYASTTLLDSQRICKNFTTNQEGDVEVLTPSDHSASISFDAVKYPALERNFNSVMEKSDLYKYRYNSKMFSGTHNSSISIFIGDDVECTDGKPVSFVIPLVYVVQDLPAATIYLKGISRGQVQFQHSQEVQFTATELPFDSSKFLVPLPEIPANIVRGMVNISVTMPNSISPGITLLAWFKNADGVVFADTTKVDVTPCLPATADLSWSKKQAEPASPVDLTLTTGANSLCSIGVVDKSVQLLSPNKRISVKDILAMTNDYEIQRWEGDQQNIEYCYNKYKDTEKVKKMKLPVDVETGQVDFKVIHGIPRYSEEIEALHAFNNAGFYVFSDLNLEKEFCDALFDAVLKKLLLEETVPGTPVHVLGDSLSGGTQMKISSAGHRPPAPAAQSFASPAGGGFGVAADKEGTVVEESSRERVYFPETWLWELSTVPASGVLTETHQMPDTITEWIGSAVCINEVDGVSITKEVAVTTFTPFFTDLTLPARVKRQEILPVIVSVFSYQDSALPVIVQLEASPDFEFVAEGTATETGKREICIPANDKTVVTFKVKAKIIGDLNLTIEATTNAQDTSCNANAPVKKDRMVRSLPVEAEGFLREKVLNKYLCAEDYTADAPIEAFQLTLGTADIVPGSDRAWVTAIGDLLGPSIENLGNLIAFPSGCGEQNMMRLAPNIFILEYLQAAKEGSEETIQKLKDFMASGYQRQLTFRHPDGSYSTFGNRDIEGSTWLTAFVLKSFAHAKKHIFVDDNIQKKSAEFLSVLQQPNGCFESKGRVVNKLLQGGSSDQRVSSLLTAYVASAFVEAGLDTPEDTVMSKALPCINSNTSDHPYEQALKAYALALAKSPDAKAAVDALVASAVSTPSVMRWDIPGKNKNSALAVETAAYSLMAMLALDQAAYTEQTRKIVRWLSTQRNGQGGFVSTQDTVVALQALAQFEKLQPAGPLDLAVTAKIPSIEKSFLVDETNKFLQQRFDLDTPSSVDLTIQGTGCALLQGTLRYNVLGESKGNAFVLKNTVTPDAKCKFQTISTCMSYTLPDLTSNMAILEVSLPSGFVPVKDSLKKAVSINPFMRYEVDGPAVNFYLEEVTSTEVCASFEIFQEISIENLQNPTIKLYDYYQPEFKTELTYTVPTTPSCSTSP